MKSKNTSIIRGPAMVFALYLVVPVMSMAAVTDLSNAPLASGVGGSVILKPNIAFVVDDSGSMDDQNMPGDDNDNKGSRCYGWNKYNTLFYNPAYTYKPPFKIDGAVYSDGVRRFPDASFTGALQDGYFASGGYTFGGNSTSNGTTNLSTLGNLVPNAVSCTAAAKATTTITVGGSGSTSVTSIDVGGTIILNSASTASNNTGTVATNVAAKINQAGYTASASGNTITITAPLSAGNVIAAPVVTKSGGMSFTAAAFSGYAANECPTSPSKYYYSVHKTSTTASTCQADSNYNIVTDPNAIQAPGVAAGSAAARTNYANWYSYYRRRAFMLKVAAGEAFKDLDEAKFRVGLFFINSIESGSSSGSKVNNDLKIADFSGSGSGTQRYDWYTKLYANRKGGATPLRGALSRMGQMYAGQISGWDPVQYSCQQNFTIMSTDGYWNGLGENPNDESATYTAKKINNIDNVGNQDFPPVAEVQPRSTITISGANNLVVSAVMIGATNLISSATSSSNNSTTAAGKIRDAITNNSGNNGGYTATSSGSVVTITAPLGLGGNPATPTITKTGTGTVTPTAFTGYAAAIAGAARPYLDAAGASNTLADIAYYYYNTDLRTSTLGNCSNTIGGTTYNDLCTNNVLGSGKDINSQQHMTTFTIGLGVSGSITYESNYETAANIAGVTQYYDINNGTADWPNPITNTTTARIDDLWHAAVNGHGTYYSSSNADTVKTGLQSALAGVQARTGSSAAAATSNLEPVAGDNYVYVALYRTVNWDGDLKAFSIDPDTGALSGASLWSAQAQLDAQVAAAGAGADGRTIKFFSSGATSKLKDFTAANLADDGLDANFANICSKSPISAQCSSLSGAQVTTANTAANLVNYLRGQGTYEDEAANLTAANKLYRGREHVLGDTVNAVPVYMKKPPFSYETYDTTYSTFKSNNVSRAGTVFVAANDGMLHAINADNGNERWAYVPRLVMPNMWKLADTNYANNHNYYVDGSPTVADICTTLSSTNAQLCADNTNWKTIVIGGLNKGGCGYYAIDVTDPTAPKGLWEFTNANLGYSFGNPVVGKRKDGTWVVIFSSGYNNYPSNGCGSTGDGNGHVFVVDAATGALLEDIPTYTTGTTPAGTTGTPSGLSKLNAWIDNAALPIIDRLYGGDMLGNLWRFDYDGNYPPATGTGKEAVRIAQLTDGTNPQPITIKPELAEVTSGASTYSVVMVGTGKYLGTGDLSDTSQQSIYALKDTLGATGIGAVRGTGSTTVARTLTQTTGTSGTTNGVTIRTITGTDINWASNDGWYMDLNPGGTSPGERVSVDMSLQYNILTVAANVPSNNACDVGGHAYLYFLDINSGKNLSTASESMVGKLLSGNALVAGIKTLKLASGKTITIITDTAGGVTPEDNPSRTSGGGNPARRTTWREISD